MLDDAEYKNSDGYKALNAQGTFLDKFYKDNELSDNEKKKFLEYIKKYNESVNGNFKEYAREYMWKNQLKSSTEFTGDLNTSNFIHINDEPRFIAWAKKLTKDDNIESTIKKFLDPATDQETKQTFFNAFQNSELKQDIIEAPALSEQYLGIPALSASVEPILKEGKTSEHIEWSFPEPEDENLFSDEKMKNLDCRAGLRDNQDLDKVVYRQLLNECGKVCKPTIFDAEFSPQFEPGGKTIPLDDCYYEEGFDEFVHESNHFKKLTNIPVLIKK